MNTVTLESFYVIGISVRTTNVNNKALKDIGELFGNFVGQNILQKIPNKISEDIYCVYTDYESDFNGPYTTIIGCKVSSLEDIPKGLIGKSIPESKYQVYKSTGKLSISLANTWERIWNSDLHRRYSADFDIYGEKARDFENAELDTYVAII
ncbi:MAG TPA: GyrI-like domain-containing protein [Puia sp.]|nr:GyrI-like domain-containing protein [Puia sp.]